MADKKLFALCVGINEYPEGVSNLAGCITDAENWKTFIESTYQKTLSPEVLLLQNEQAKRASFIEAVRQHLGQARDGDVVFLHYSGHGSREASPPAYLKYFPEGKNESLVLSDSRAKDAQGNYTGYDLSSSELGKLLEEISENKPNLNLVVSLDCCHSGSGTRDAAGLAKSRLTGDRAEEARPIESFLPGIFTADSANPPDSKHILLASCSKYQKAWETKQKTGLFTTSVMEILDRYGSYTSYSDLFVRTRTLIRKTTKIQDPQLEVYEKYNANQVLFTGEVLEGSAKYAQRVYHVDNGWTLNFGAIHGMPNSQTTELAIYENMDTLQQQNPVGHAKTVQVMGDKATLELDFEANPDKEYTAAFLKSPVTPIDVFVYGDLAGYEALQKAFDKHQSMYFRLVREDEAEEYNIDIQNPNVAYFTKVSVLDKAGNLVTPKAGDYQLVASDDGIYLIDENNRLVQGTIGGYQDAEGIKALFEILDDIAQWENLQHLQNQKPQLDPNQIGFTYVDTNGNDIEGEEITTYFREVDGEWQGTEFELKIANQTKQGLHFSLIYLDENYEIAPLANEYFEARTNSATILETQETWLDSYNDEGSKVAYNEELDEFFNNESTMTFKLIVSTERIDDFTIEQAPVDIGYINTGRGLKKRSKSPTQRQVTNDWFTKTITIRTIRQRAKLGASGAQLGDDNKLEIKGNAQVSADLKLSATKQGTRSADRMAILPSMLAMQNGEMVDFGGAPGGNNVLELNEIEGSDTFSDSPLTMLINEAVADEEMLLPITHDGKRLLLVGDADANDQSQVTVAIDDVPEVEEGSRSLGKSLKLAFFKIALKRHPDKLYELAWVEYLNTQDKHGREQIDRHRDNDEIAEKLKSANKVLLLIHGIIGDTEDMAIGVKDMVTDKGYDLVLSFDYENLNSSIRDDISWSLKDQLDRVGFKADDGKELHILAQGMGCLVARWMVEQRKGHEFVDRLILAGPPNQGSILGNIETVRKFATIALNLTLNVLSPLASWAGGLLKGVKNAMKQSKQLTTTLAEMQEGSSFIRDLNDSDDTGIPYLILAGDVRNYEPSNGSDFSKFREKMYKKVGTFANSGEANDMIVDFASMKRPGKNSKVEITKVVCHHLNYFEEEASLNAIREIL